MPVRKWYTVYQAYDDELLTIGIDKDCANNLDMSIETFRSVVTKVKLGKNRRYIIAVEEVDDDYEETNGKVEIYGEDNFGLDLLKKYRFDENEAMYLYLMKNNDKQIANKLNVSKGTITLWRKKEWFRIFTRPW